MMYTSLRDARILAQGAITHTAKALGIAANETRLDLAFEAIRGRDPVVFAALDAFLSGWAVWYAMHKALDESGASGRLDAAQQSALAARINDKETARRILVDLLRNP
jgi:hypothetical protein